MFVALRFLYATFILLIIFKIKLIHSYCSKTDYDLAKNLSISKAIMIANSL